MARSIPRREECARNIARKEKPNEPKEDDNVKREGKAEEEARQKRRPLIISIGVVIVLLLIGRPMPMAEVESQPESYRSQ